MGTVHPIFPPTPELLTIYPPRGSSPDDRFEALVIPDDSLSRGTIYKGDVVIIKLGLIRPTGLHAVLTPRGKRVCFLSEQDDLICLECNNDEYESELYKHGEVEILGRVVQVYPGGDVSERWELIRAPRVLARAAFK